MTNLKRSTAAVALLMASSLPAFAHVPDEVILQLQGTDDFYRVPIATAAELCQIGEDELEDIIEDLTVDANVVYCVLPALPTTGVETFVPVTEEDFTPTFTNFEDGDDDDDDGDSTDDAQETAVDEANDAEDDDGSDLEDAFEEDDEEAPENNDDGIDGADDSAGDNTTDEDTTENTTDGGTTEGTEGTEDSN